MVRPRPSLARRVRQETSSTPRLTPTSPPSLSLRSRFNRVRPLVNKWRGGGAATPAPAGASGIRISGTISKDLVSRTIVAGRYVKAEQINRWAAIQAGQLPADDDTPRPPTSDQVEEREREELDEAHRWGEARNDAIREETHHEVSALNSQADDAEATYGPGRPAALRHARRLRSQAQDVAEEGRTRMAAVADQVREARAESRQHIRREADQAEERAQQRIEELRSGLKAEVQTVVNAQYFHTDEFELDGFDLI